MLQKYLRILCGVPTLVITSDQMIQIGMCGVPPLILKHLVRSVVNLAQLVSPSVALPAELVFLVAICRQFSDYQVSTFFRLLQKRIHHLGHIMLVACSFVENSTKPSTICKNSSVRTHTALAQFSISGPFGKKRDRILDVHNLIVLVTDNK